MEQKSAGLELERLDDHGDHLGHVGASGSVGRVQIPSRRITGHDLMRIAPAHGLGSPCRNR